MLCQNEDMGNDDVNKPLTPPAGIRLNDNGLTIVGIHIPSRNSGWAVDSAYLNTPSGIGPWLEGTKINLDKTDPRYMACLEVAHDLKSEQPAASEERIAQILTAKIHEQYGNYNYKPHGLLHGESGNFFSLRNFKKGELVCREYAFLMSALSAEAGIPNVLVEGPTHSFSISNGGPLHIDGGEHVFIVSKRPPYNVLDGTDDNPRTAYNKNVSGLSIQDILKGKTIVTLDSAGNISTYGSGRDDAHQCVREAYARGKLTISQDVATQTATATEANKGISPQSLPPLDIKHTLVIQPDGTLLTVDNSIRSIPQLSGTASSAAPATRGTAITYAPVTSNSSNQPRAMRQVELTNIINSHPDFETPGVSTTGRTVISQSENGKFKVLLESATGAWKNFQAKVLQKFTSDSLNITYTTVQEAQKGWDVARASLATSAPNKIPVP